ncbi:MAG: TonB-dependent receptor [Tannerellaceae bacterium]|nr:TonB-dependent receptor [Tannerellaceae bacterium]
MAQTINITGKVTEASGEPIIGGTVILQGTSAGTVTGADGSYSISAPENGVLEFRYIGLETEIVSIGGRRVINVALQSSAIAVDEVVVIGYGTQSRRTVTASIASLSGESIRDIPSPNAESALQGRASGVSIITPSGAVGQAPVVRIRGVSSITSGTEPLYVVDGIPIQAGNVAYIGNTNALSDINPADILSIDVLKDAAAAALYGSRAANGVVLITTRKGRQDKAQVTYGGWIGVTTPSKLIDVLNAEQYVELKNLAVANRYGTDERSLTPSYTSSHGNKAFNLWQLGNGQHADTDWASYLYQTGLQHNHTLGVSGGTAKVQYYISANYTDQKGMVENDHYDRLGGVANVTAQAANWLKVGINLNATTSSTSYTDRGRKGSQYATANFSRMAMILPPNTPVYDPETGIPYYEANGGMGYGSNTVQNGYYNPVAMLEYGDKQQSDITRVISSYFAEFTLLEGLTLKTQLGIDYMGVADEQFNNPFNGDSFASNGASYKASVSNKATTWTNTAQYTFSLGEHNFDILVGQESYAKNFERWGAYRTDILDSKFTVYQADYSNIYPYANTLEESSLLSYLGRLNYDYQARYMLSVNFRRDGFSALSKNNRWGNFGGASAAWRISNEDFFEPLSTLFTDLKIKGSWGIVGNTNIGPYAAKSYYQSGFYGTNSAYYLSSIADTENLKWEASSKLDIGFSAQIKNNVTVDFDFYRNYASDLILDVPVAYSKGIPNNKITTNAGAMTNTGIELSVSATPVKTSDFSWNTSFNITTQKNEVVQLAEGVTEIVGANDYNITVPGKSIGQLYIRPSAGIDPATGRRILIGEDGTQVLVMFERSGTFFRKDNDESYLQGNIKQQIFGGTMPTYYGGWTNDFKYKNFDLSVLLQYSGGNYIYNGSTATLSDMRDWNNSVDMYNNAWRNPGDQAKFAKPIYSDNTSNGSAFPISDWVEKGDYLRLKTLTLGYTFNTRNWSKAGISTLRLYAAAQNLFCLTGYTGLDPESLISSNDQAALQGGVDKNTLPQAKVFTFGVNVSF